MIVKNEAAIIGRCLESLTPVIDSWVVCDTGSTDGTQRIVEDFFDSRGIRGQVVEEPFENFSQARNAALTAFRERSESDYALLVDADMEFQGHLDKAALSAPAYRLIQRDSVRSYYNTRLVRRDRPAKFVGVTHEYLEVGDPNPPRLSDCWLIDHCNGSSRPAKIVRDIALLKAGLRDEPANARYMFYLANTYRDAREFDLAALWYRKRIAAGGWDEEVWAARRMLALCYRDRGDHPEFVAAAMEAYNNRPSRAEPLHDLAHAYRLRGENEAAVAMCELGAAIPLPTDILFLEDPVYRYGFEQETSISGFYCASPARRRAGYEACLALTTHDNEAVRNEARINFSHYAPTACSLFGAKVKQLAVPHEPGYACMNTSVFCDGDRRCGIVRSVNYTVTDKWEYPTTDGSGIIKTTNYWTEFDREWHAVSASPIADRTTVPTNTAYPCVGLEDCRLFMWRGEWWCSATVRDRNDGRCEQALVRVGRHGGPGFDDMRIVRDYEATQHQKNWMPLIGEGDDVQRFVYSVDPTVVLDLAGHLAGTGGTWRAALHRTKARRSSWRGGSQLIKTSAGYLCIMHDVVWMPLRRYMHMFVLFGEDLAIRATSEPFYLHTAGVGEFCAGLARDNGVLVASFGVRDATANLAFFDEATVLEKLRAV